MKQWIKDIQLIGKVNVVENSKITDKLVKTNKSLIHTISYYEPSKKKFYWSNQQLFCHNNLELQNFNNDLDRKLYNIIDYSSNNKLNN